MNVGKTLFAQIMEFVPWTSFGRIVDRYSGNAGVFGNSAVFGALHASGYKLPNTVNNILTLNDGSQIDATTGTIKIKALFPNKDGGLFPNQFVNVRLQLDRLKDVLVLPTAAVQRGAPGTFVYVVTDGTVALRKVQVLTTDGDNTAVQGEVKPGDQVVTGPYNSVRNIADGDPVKVDNKQNQK